MAVARESYRHTQVGWVILGSLLAVATLVLPTLASAELTGVFVAACVVLAAVALLFGTLNVRIDDRAISVRFGVGLIRRTVALTDVRTFFEVKNRWYYGWGIRLFPGGMLYNVSGLEAVELWLKDGKRIRIGTDERATVYRELIGKLGQPEPLSPGELQGSRRTGGRVGLVLAVVSAALVLVVALPMYLHTRPPTVKVSAGVLSVRSVWYSQEIALKNANVSLVDRLPRIRGRTNGFALGSTLRGHFALDELGKGQLFIEHDSPPFVLIRASDSYVVVGFDDPEQTRRLHAALTER